MKKIGMVSIAYGDNESVEIGRAHHQLIKHNHQLQDEKAGFFRLKQRDFF